MIADPLWSCVMLLCGPLRYLVIPRGLAYLENISDSCHVLYSGSTFIVYFVYLKSDKLQVFVTSSNPMAKVYLL